MTAPLLALYDGAALAANITVALGPGDVSAVYTRQLWNLKAGSGDTATGVQLLEEALDGATWKRQGLPVLDGLWASVRATGVINTGDPTFSYSSGTKRLGSSSRMELPNIPANCAIVLDFRFFAPGSIQTTAIETRFIGVSEQNSYGVANKLGMLGSGILPGWRDAALRKVVTGRNITTAGTAVITAVRGIADYDGASVASLNTTHTLDQNDSVPSALTAGQAYIATISQNAAGVVTVTKGARSTTPTKPAVPADHVWLAYVTVDYEVGGTSIIADADVDDAITRTDYYFEASAGLNIAIHSGSGISTSSHYQFHGTISSLTLTASSTNYLWRRPDGTWEDNVTGLAPIDGAELLGEANTDGSSVTAIRDRRVYLSRPWDEICVEMRKASVSATGTAEDWCVVPEDAEISRVRAEVKSVSGGASGSYVFDVNTHAEGTMAAPVTIYTGQATDSRLPSIAYNATVLFDEELFHQVRRVKRGQRLSFDTDAIPAGGTATDVRISVFLRRYR